MKLARIQVSSELIREALAMPADAQIQDIMRDLDNPDIFNFFVEHPDFDEVRENEIPPLITAIVEADFTKKPSTWLTLTFGSSIQPHI